MEIYSFDENGILDPLGQPAKSQKLTPDTLIARINRLNILADVEINSPYRATVRVHKHTGTSMFLSDGPNDHIWLQTNAVKKEDKGSVIVYHFVFD